MNRYEEVLKMIDNVNKGDGMRYQKLVVLLLADICKSLAIIADTLQEKNYDD